ncbi:MAG TPA: tRNA (adenosine(37)-N6)-threonylcarbamoyltransferase complex ATPase subunit type 1 TsaE [Bdellovibrionota bacterium]|jgi:tRNA threonylcarbamoyl adenosine modification protein YjeE
MKGSGIKKNLRDEGETLALGAFLAPRLDRGDIVKITGELGAGKTTLVRGIVTALGGDPSQVHSPTFSLVHHYQTASIEIIHCDFYRLPEGSGLDEFGGLEFFESDSIFLIEWPERVKLFDSTIPNRLLCVDLRVDSSSREAHITGPWKIVD